VATRIRKSIQQDYDACRKLLPGIDGACADAIEAGSKARGPKPVLVKRIRTFEAPPFLDRAPAH
jgi:hypothetical protein